MLQAEVRGHAERERGLAHAGAAGDDDQVARLEARRHVVDVAEPGGRAGHLAARLVHLRDLLEALAHELVDALEAAADPVLGEVEHHLLGSVDQLRRLARSIPAEPLDLLADDREAAQRRHLADDLARSARRSTSPGRASRSRGSALLPPTSSSSPRSSSLSATVIASTGWPVLVQLDRGAVDLRVRLAVEVARVHADVARRLDRRLGQHHRAEHRLLGVEVLRRQRSRPGSHRRRRRP